jgi:hypothetical protein
LKKTRNNFEKEFEKFLKKKKIKHKYENKKIPYVYSGHYLVDWDLGAFIVETKGYFRPADKRKMAAVKKCNPTLDIRFLFMRYKEADVRWCKKYGFPYAIGTMPDEWLVDLC